VSASSSGKTVTFTNSTRCYTQRTLQGIQTIVKVSDIIKDDFMAGHFRPLL